MDNKALISELETKIEKMKKVVADPATPENTRKMIQFGLDKAEKQLAELKQSMQEVEKATEKIEEAKKDSEKAPAAPSSKKTLRKEVSQAVAKLKEKKTAAQKQVVKASSDLKKTSKTLSDLVKSNPKLKSIYSGLSEKELRDDAGRPAKKPGKRISSTGKTYYEHRPNRVDITRSKKGPLLEQGGQVKNPKYWADYESFSDGSGELPGSTSSEFNVAYRDAMAFKQKEKKAGQLDDYSYMGVNGEGDRFAIVHATKDYINSLRDFHFKSADNYKVYKEVAEKCLETGKPQKGSYAKIKETGGEIHDQIWLSVDGNEPVTYEQFYSENTAEDVEPLTGEEFAEIKSLQVGETWGGGGASGVEVKRVSAPSENEDQDEPEPERELLLDGNRGIYIPKDFYDRFDFAKFGLKKEDYEDLSSPDNEFYWEAWDDLLSDAATPEGHYLEQEEGDLWLVKPKSHEAGGELDMMDQVYAAGGTLPEDLEDENVVLIAETKGGKYRIFILKHEDRFKDGKVYEIHEYVNNEPRGFSGPYDKNTLTARLNYQIDASAKIDGVNYQVIKNDENIKILVPKKNEAYLSKREIIARLELPIDTVKAFKSGGEIDGIDLEDVYKGYASAALWSTNDIDTDEPLDQNYSLYDICHAAKVEMKRDIEKFVKENSQALKDSGLDDEQIGHDFWLTRNGHGAGFWDRGLEENISEQLTKSAGSFKTVDLYVGDDGIIHSMSEKKTREGGGKIDENSHEKKIINGVAHDVLNGSEFDYHKQTKKTISFNHPLGMIHSDGKYGYVQNGYNWLRFPMTKENMKALKKPYFEKGGFSHDDKNFEHKKKQFEIIQKTNPKHDTFSSHTWIENINDIKTGDESFNQGIQEDGGTPDFTVADMKKALSNGEVMVYSSFPIRNGIFVTPSKMEAKNYAGSGQVYSKKVKLSEVAWIDEIQGQYANVEELGKNQRENGGAVSKPNYVPGLFSIYEKEYEGYHDPSIDWNGFTTPVFEKRAALQILKDEKIKHQSKNGELFAKISGEMKKIGPRTIEVNGKKVEVYDIGAFSWSWELAGNVETMRDKILNFVEGFPLNATSWSQATDEIAVLHNHMANLYNEKSGSTYQFDFSKISTTPAEKNKRHSEGIKKLINILEEKDVEEVFNHYKEWFK